MLARRMRPQRQLLSQRLLKNLLWRSPNLPKLLRNPQRKHQLLHLHVQRNPQPRPRSVHPPPRKHQHHRRSLLSRLLRQLRKLRRQLRSLPLRQLLLRRLLQNALLPRRHSLGVKLKAHHRKPSHLQRRPPQRRLSARPLQSGADNLFAVSVVCLKRMPYALFVTMPHAAYLACLNSAHLLFPPLFVCTGTRSSCRFTQLRVSRLGSCLSVFF
ncbi:hypothetical protein JB92DRAFT_2961399 [Gautieria morchelliformis]|nr:hypothetical protein JB92DRAFT_2961399 [Gautieria morchelliformis]